MDPCSSEWLLVAVAVQTGIASLSGMVVGAVIYGWSYAQYQRAVRGSRGE